ncbi:MAG: hypothetical protein PVJ60_06340 [Phycisphaerales bacterium]|jgi:hypothetical protein
MDLTDTKLKDLTKGKRQRAREFMYQLLPQEAEFPVKEIVGLSEAEQTGQELLNKYLATGTPAGTQTAINELTKTVEGGYDPVTSLAYKGYRDQSKLEEQNAINELKRRLQLVGHGGFSTPALNAEGQTRRGYSADRMSFLGQLYDQERNRQTAAAVPLATLSDTAGELPLRQTAAAAAYGGAERTIEQQREDALYESLVQELLFPYIYQMPVAQSLLAEQRIFPESGGSDTDLGGMLGMMGGSFLGAGGLNALMGSGAAAGGAAASTDTAMVLAAGGI